MVDLNVGGADVVVALSASGSTPFTCAALEEAVARRATGVAVTCGSGSRLVSGATIPIVIAVGREVVEGSTRMKAGTAQKLICNAISTVAFIRLGRVWGQHMVGVQSGNEKLRKRAEAILQRLGECADEASARALLAHADYDLPTALVMARAGVEKEAAERCLEQSHGDVHEALRLAQQLGPS
jgi:N-acetylmuramic acid 6-phosphate etherase